MPCSLLMKHLFWTVDSTISLCLSARAVTPTQSKDEEAQLQAAIKESKEQALKVGNN